MISQALTEHDLGKWVEYHTEGMEKPERGRIKAYRNDQRKAWVVFHADGNLEKPGHAWKDYTAEMVDYSHLTFVDHGDTEVPDSSSDASI